MQMRQDGDMEDWTGTEEGRMDTCVTCARDAFLPGNFPVAHRWGLELFVVPFEQTSLRNLPTSSPSIQVLHFIGDI